MKWTWGAALALVAVPSAPTHASATRVDAVELFRLAEAARAEGRTTDAETMVRALTVDPDAEVRAEARFRLATMLEALGRRQDAAVLLRRLLDEKPDAARVRIELARLLAQMGDESAARRELRQVQTGALPPDVALAVDQFATVLRSRKRLGGSFELALAPDSNINRATSAQVLDTVIAPLQLSDDARARSGLGLRASGQGYARLPLTSSLSILPRIAEQADLYRDGRFNDVSLSLATGLDWQADPRDRITPILSQGWRWFGGPLYSSTQSGAVNWTHAAGRRAQLSAAAVGGTTRYPRNPLQNGALFSLSASYERAFSARSGGSLSLSVTRQTARDPGYASVSGGPSLLGWRDSGRTTIFATVGAARLEGDAPFFLFPDRRRDWLLRGSVGATMRRFTLFGFAPVLRATAERNISTVGLYDYRRFAVEAGITRAF